MSLAALTAIKTLLSNDAAIYAFFVERYGKAAKHQIGYRRLANASEYPCVSYVKVRSARGELPNDKELIAIVTSLHEAGSTDDAFDGITQTAQLEDLILTALGDGNIADGVVWADGIADCITDLGATHPYYQNEIQINVLVRNFE